MMKCDCGNQVGHAHNCALFTCAGCGGPTSIGPGDDGPAYCADCCPDHNYEYERGVGHRCQSCDAEPPIDWFDVPPEWER